MGEYGLRNKRELWRVQMQLSKIRNAARTLLTLEERDPRRIFQGNALLKRMYRYGLLDESQKGLDYVLALQPSDFLERRLQTLVFKLGHAKSIHHARVLIRQRHIRCVLIYYDQLPKLSTSAGCSVGSHGCIADDLNAESGSSLSTCPHSLSAWTARSTLTLLCGLHSVAAALAV